MLFRLLSAFLLGLLAAALPAQRTWIVDRNNGPGTDFLDLPPAVAAAAPGDIIRVRPAPGQLYEAPVVAKALSILGDPVTRPVIIGVLEVSNVPAGSVFMLAGFKLGTLETNGPTIRTTRGIVCQDNLGLVRIDALEYGVDPAIQRARNTDPRGVLFERCALVSISGSLMWCSNYSTIVRDSTLIATDSRFRESGPYSLPVETLFIQRSQVTLIDCEAIGSDGFYAPVYGVLYPSPAILLCNATVSIGGYSQLFGGYFYGGGQSTAILASTYSNCQPPAVPVPVVFRDPRSTVLGTIGLPYAIEHFDPVPGVRWSTSISQTSLTTTQYTNPNSTTLLVAGALLPAALPGPLGTLGTLFLDPAAIFLLDVGITSASGERTWTIPIPSGLPAPTIVPIQAVELTTNGGLLLTNLIVPGVF